jgi:hypothetical protein
MATDLAPSAKSTRQDSHRISADVKRFCADDDLASLLSLSMDLAGRCFGPERTEVELMQDPDTNDEWVVVRIDVRGSAESVLASKKRYTAEWVAMAPWPQRHLIRLSLNVV